jgi:hypothetical protein
MKKFSLLIVAISVILLSLQACKSSERCPAYGELQTSQQINKA